MSKGSLIKGRNGKERNKVLAVFQKRVLAPHTIPSFSLLGISALERAPTAAAGLDGGWPSRPLSLAHCAASWLRWSLTLRVLTSATWNPTHLEIEFSIQLKANTRQVREGNLSTSSGSFFSVFGLPGMAQSWGHRGWHQHRLGTGQKHKSQGVYSGPSESENPPRGGGRREVGKGRRKGRQRRAQQPVF